MIREANKIIVTDFGLSEEQQMHRDMVRRISDIHFVEINEAFAAVSLVSTLLMTDKDREKAKTLRERTNMDSSAIAVGQPNTASGARLMMNLMYELHRKGGGYALGAICGGLAQADACIIKV